MRFYENRRPQSGWRKASYCGSGECVEITKQSNVIFLRNSTQPRKVVRYTAEEWQAFAKGLAAGEFRDLG